MASHTLVRRQLGPDDVDGQPIEIVELISPQLTVRMLSLGASLWQLFPTGSGPDESLCLFYESPADYAHNETYFGSYVGPVANRIGNSRFRIDDDEYRLEPNDGVHHLHGGPNGFSNRQWSVATDDSGVVRFELQRPDGEDGYPGNLTVVAEWTLDGARLTNRWTATSDRVTPVSLTNHSYWNLAATGDILDHRIEIPASSVVVADSELISTGELASVGTLDTRSSVRVGDLVAANEPGIDQSYVLDRPGPSVLSAPGGRSVTVTTTLPILHLYTGQKLLPASTDGRYGPFSGLCLETQHPPNAVNHPTLASPLVGPASPVEHVTTWEFAI